MRTGITNKILALVLACVLAISGLPALTVQAAELQMGESTGYATPSFADSAEDVEEPEEEFTENNDGDFEETAEKVVIKKGKVSDKENDLTENAPLLNTPKKNRAIAFGGGMGIQSSAVAGDANDGIDFTALMAGNVYYGTYRHATAFSNTQYARNLDDNDNDLGITYDSEKRPVLWRVMGEETAGTMTLLSEYAVDGYYFCHEKEAPTANQWEYSDLRKWLNTPAYEGNSGDGDDGEYGFLHSSKSGFTAAELGNPIITASVNTTTYDYRTEEKGATQATQDRFYIPWGMYSNKEQTANVGKVWWGADDVPESTCGISDSDKIAKLKGGTPVHSWLRSLDTYDTNYALMIVVVDGGDEYSPGEVISGYVRAAFGVRPAFQLNQSSVLFASKIAEDANTANGETEKAAGYYSTGEDGREKYKLTILNTGVKLNSLMGPLGPLNSGVTLTVVPGGTLDLAGVVSGGADKLVYKIVQDVDGTRSIVGYGAGNATSLTVNGKANVTDDANLTVGGDYTLYVWAQKDNDHNSHEGSEPMYFELEVGTPAGPHTVIFELDGGTRTGGGDLEQIVPDGGAATAPTVTRDGYTFDGWDKSFSNVTSDLTVTAQWSNNTTPTPSSTSDRDGNNGNISVYGINVPYSIHSSSGVMTIELTTTLLDKIVTAANKNKTIAINAGNRVGLKELVVSFPPLWLAEHTDITIPVQSGIGGITLSHNLAKQFPNQGATATVSLKTGSLIFSARQSGKTVTWNDTNALVAIYMPYTPPTNSNTNAVVLYNKTTGVVVAHSFYSGGKVYAAVGGPGIYDAKVGAGNFTDTQGHWAIGDIIFASSHGLIAGTSATAFSPDAAITRADFIVALGKLSSADVSKYEQSSFTDVANDSPAMPYIEWAAANKIVQGIGNHRFGPTQAITREQMAVMLTSYANATGQTLPKVRTANTFADGGNISAWAKEAVTAVQQADIMTGKTGNVFAPQASATRAEASAILRRFAESTVNGEKAWVQTGEGKWMYIGSDYLPRKGWLAIANSDTKYYLDTNGLMVTGKWLQLDSKWHYFYDNGKMAKNTAVEGYEIDEYGVRN